MARYWQAVRGASRSLRGRPAFAATAAAVLSLGIAAVSTIFGVTSGILFRPLPYDDADRLVFVFGSEPPGSDALPLSPDEFTLVREEARSFRSLAALTDDVALVGTGRAARSRRGIRVSPQLAQTLGAGVRLGRLPQPGDGSAGVDLVVVGDTFWLRELEGDPAIVGQAIVLDGQAVRVAGVLGPGSRLKGVLGFEPAWWRLLPRGAGPLPRGRRLIGIGRLSDGSSLQSAGAELELLATRLERKPGATPGRTLRATPVRDRIDPIAYALVGLLLAAMLGIACLNVGALLLSRALAREREMAVRLALGAGRSDVFGQLVAEGVLVGLVGGVLGLALTAAAVGLVRDLASGTNAEAVVFEVDAWVWAAAAAASLVAGVLAGLVPALYWVRQEPESILKEGGHGATATPRSRRLKNLLIASEVAVSLALLTQAGLTLRSLRGLLGADRGFAATRVLTARLSFGPGAPDSAAEVLRRVRVLPGSRDAAFATALPTGGPMQPYRTVGGGGEGDSGQARVAAVSPGYFGTLGIVLHAGRDFTAADVSGSALVAIVNDELAGRLGKAGSALGAVVEVAGARRTVVGVAASVRNPPLALRPRPEVYLPWAPGGEAHLLADTALDRPLALAADLAAALRAAGPDEPPATVRSLESVLAADMGVIRLGTLLLGLLALGAVAITVAGTYGVVSSLLVLRTREMGVRLALGAEPAVIRRLALEQGLRPVLAGLLVGALAALALGRLLSSRLYGLRPLEPAVLAVAVLAFVAVVAPACYLPARRATRVDPAVTLRCE